MDEGLLTESEAPGGRSRTSKGHPHDANTTYYQGPSRSEHLQSAHATHQALTLPRLCATIDLTVKGQTEGDESYPCTTWPS